MMDDLPAVTLIMIIRSALAMEALSTRAGVNPSRSALLLREASNYLEDVIAASGQDVDAVRDVAREVLERCELALRVMSAGTARGPISGLDQPPQSLPGGTQLGGPGGGGLGQAGALLGNILGQRFGGKRY